MCKVLNVPRSTYYKAKNTEPSKRAKENKALEDEITAIYEESSRRYGAPKIHYILQQSGYKISIKRVQRLMRKLEIASIVHPKYINYKQKDPIYQKRNILNRNFFANKLNEKWVGDITYIHTVKDGWCYLASVMDLHTRKIIGYSFDKNMDTKLIISALKNAYAAQRPNGEVMFHSDLGTQYTSVEFTSQLKKYNMVASYSNKGCPYDNACIESFHSILKKEEINHFRYYDFHSAKLAIFKFIESWYNRKRIHGSIGYLTPQMKENLARKSS